MCAGCGTPVSSWQGDASWQAATPAPTWVAAPTSSWPGPSTAGSQLDASQHEWPGEWHGEWPNGPTAGHGGTAGYATPAATATPGEDWNTGGGALPDWASRIEYESDDWWKKPAIAYGAMTLAALLVALFVLPAFAPMLPLWMFLPTMLWPALGAFIASRRGDNAWKGAALGFFCGPMGLLLLILD